MENVLCNLEISEKSKDILQKVLSSDDPNIFDIGVRAIFDNIYSYDDMCLAGRLLIYEITRVVPSVKIYLALNRSRLAPNISTYIKNNIDYFEKIVKDAEKYNFENHDYFSANTLCRSYLLKATYGHKPTETPVLKNLRIAVQFYYDYGLDKVTQAFDEMNKSYYTHSSPTIFNAGTKRPQMAACFLIPIEDDLKDMLYGGIGNVGVISSVNGGIGLGLGQIRHSSIGGLATSAGVVAYARVADRSIGYANQGGQRNGAGTGFIGIWHLDVEDFIQSSSNYISHELRLSSLHTCLWMHDLFYERCAVDGNWTLFCPNTAPLFGKYGEDFEKEYIMYEKLAIEKEENFNRIEKEYLMLRHKLSSDECSLDEFIVLHDIYELAKKKRIVFKTVKARSVMDLIVKTQIQSGKPYVMNGDRCNYKSNQKNLGPINQSNLCVEIVEYTTKDTYASCNLASMNLPRFTTGKPYPHNDKLLSDEEIMKILTELYDFDTLGKMVQSVVSNLDQVIDKNYYPLDEKFIKKPNLETRPLGIGVSGLDDTFKILDLPYMSREATILNKMIFACMYYNGLVKSCNLAKERGEYEKFRTGSYKKYIGNGEYEIVSGSPLSNGQFQFDLWQEEYEMDAFRGRIRSPYDPKDNIPILPEQWGMIGNSWETLRSNIIRNGVRNSLLLAIMPTASTAQILRNAESVESHQSNIYSRQVLSGNYTIVNRHLYKDLKTIGMLNKDVIQIIFDNNGKVTGFTDIVRKFPHLCPQGVLTPELEKRLLFLEEKYRGMFEIKMAKYLTMARQRGIYIDQSQSTNAFMIDPTEEQRIAYQNLAQNLHLKTHMYYLRNNITTTDGGFNKTISSLEQKKAIQDATVVEEEPAMMCRMEEGCVSCS